MYNRYIPGSNGVYKKQCVNIPDSEPQPICKELSEQHEPPKNTTCHQTHHCQQRNWDLGDILLLCVVVLLLIDSEDGEVMPILIAVAAYLFLQ